GVGLAAGAGGGAEPQVGPVQHARASLPRSTSSTSTRSPRWSRAGDVARVPGGEEDGDARDFLGPREPPERGLGEHRSRSSTGSASNSLQPRSDSTLPGAIAFTVIPSRPRAWATLRVSWRTPPFGSFAPPVVS